MSDAVSDPQPPPPRILVVEDERKTLDSVAEGLRLEAWHVETAASASMALELLEHERFDVIVLDRLLPDIEGIEIVRRIRAKGLHTPVLMLTALGSLQDRIVGLDSGADDYLSKPFAFAELLARCRALLRRHHDASDRLLRCGDLQLDTRARVATRAGTEIPLTPREVDVMEYLLRSEGQIVTREMLERDVWKQANRLTSLDNVIDVQMMRLRKKIDFEGAERLIHTIRGVGYQVRKDRK
jgi:DNA-binding response OmpR family regulator